MVVTKLNPCLPDTVTTVSLRTVRAVQLPEDLKSVRERIAAVRQELELEKQRQASRRTPHKVRENAKRQKAQRDSGW